MRREAFIEYIIFLLDILVSLKGERPPNTNHFLEKLEYSLYLFNCFSSCDIILFGIGNILFEFFVYHEHIL